MSINYVVSPGGKVRGSLRVPGDKSISHRSIMLGALAEGTTHVKGFLEGDDALATLKAFRKMGVVIDGPKEGELIISGVGLHGLQPSDGPLYLGNAGTAMRLMAGLMAAQSFDSVLTGDASLSGRPMGRVINPLIEMGAQIKSEEQGRPPLHITGGKFLRGIQYVLPMASAQVKSCLLLAGLYAKGETQIREPGITRDHTERMLRAFGYHVETKGDQISLTGGGVLTATDIEIPADISSAAFFMVAASIAEGSDIMLESVGINPTRRGVIDILLLMGADISLFNERMLGGEPVADIQVKYAPLRGIDIPKALVPLAIDEFPVLFIAAASAEGTTRLTGAEELRVKESNRIQSMADGLIALGVKVLPTHDGIEITGGTMGGGNVDSCHDHRISMAFTVAGLRASAPIIVKDCANVATSFPGFISLAQGVGMRVEKSLQDN